ncbi:Hydroxylysine kinase [Holothuria leucospilota]|uniref:Hydroxylysine kinase n=1 Tax=Holothuria leucospilota TaxID=206669 RepID=A0A9Q0YMD3_HOLLE|nr:Hydroxylysine kinase [Holothuria leucospilota]
MQLNECIECYLDGLERDNQRKAISNEESRVPFVRRPVPNKNGDLCQLLTFENLSFKTPGSGTSLNKNKEDTFMIRLVTFLPGTVLNTLPLVPNNVFEEMGEMLAQMHLALQELDMDKIALQEMGENFSWSLDCLNKAREYLYVVEDSEKRQLVGDVMNEFDRVVLSRK